MTPAVPDYWLEAMSAGSSPHPQMLVFADWLEEQGHPWSKLLRMLGEAVGLRFVLFTLSLPAAECHGNSFLATGRVLGFLGRGVGDLSFAPNRLRSITLDTVAENGVTVPYRKITQTVFDWEFVDWSRKELQFRRTGERD